MIDTVQDDPESIASLLRTKYRNRLPSSLEELTGPEHGVVELPLHVAWSGLRAFDLDHYDVPDEKHDDLVALGAEPVTAGDLIRRLRASGLVASVDLRGRPLARNLSDAARRGAAFVAIVGVEERQSRTVVWRDLGQRDERRVALDEIGGL